MPRKARRYIDPRWPSDVGEARWTLFGDQFIAAHADEKCKVSWCPYVAAQAVDGWPVCHWHGFLLARSQPLPSVSGARDN